MADPLNDPIFATRLSKLLPMLGSSQSAEADTARRKLIEHLNSQGLTLNDLASRLQRQVAVSAAPANPRVSDSERRVAQLRAILAETTNELTQQRNTVLEQQRAVDRLALLASKLKRARDRAVTVAVAAGLAICAAGAFLVSRDIFQHDASLAVNPGQAALFMETGDEAAAHALLPPGPGEIRGNAAVQDLALHYEPREDSGVRAYLTMGAALIIMREATLGDRHWLLVRSASGMGWARSGDVLLLVSLGRPGSAGPPEA
jgi:DNA-binding transcriptional MerR regulator